MDNIIIWKKETISNFEEKFKFSFKVGGQLKAVPFNQQLYNKLNNSLKDGSLIFNMDKYNPENKFDNILYLIVYFFKYLLIYLFQNLSRVIL